MKAHLRPLSALFCLALFLSVIPSGIHAQDAEPPSKNVSSPPPVNQQGDPDLIGQQYDNNYGHSGEQARKDFFGPLAPPEKSELNSDGGNEADEKIKGNVYKTGGGVVDAINKGGRDDRFEAGLGEIGKQVAKNNGSKLIKASLINRLYQGTGMQGALGADFKKQIANLKDSIKVGRFASKAGAAMPYVDAISTAAGHLYAGQYKDAAIAATSGISRAAFVNMMGDAGATAGTPGGPVLSVVGAIGSAWVAGAIWDGGIALGKGLPGKGITGKIGNMLDTFFNLSAPPNHLPSNYRGESILENDTLVLDPSQSPFTANLPPSFVENSSNITFSSRDPDISSFADDPGAITPEIKMAVSGVDPESSFDNALPFDDTLDIGSALKGVETLVSNSGGKEADSEAGETIAEKLQAAVKNELAQDVTGSLQAGAKNEVIAENKAKQRTVVNTGRRVSSSSSGSSSSGSSSGRSRRVRIIQPTKHVCTTRCNH